MPISASTTKNFKNHPGIIQWGENGAPSNGFSYIRPFEDRSYIEIIPEINGHQYPLDFYDNISDENSENSNLAIIDTSHINSTYFTSFWIQIDNSENRFYYRTSIEGWKKILFVFSIENSGFYFTGKNGKNMISEIESNTWYHICIKDAFNGKTHSLKVFIDGFLEYEDIGNDTDHNVSYAYFASSPIDSNYHVYIDALYVGISEGEAFSTIGGVKSNFKNPEFLKIPNSLTYEKGTKGNFIEWIIKDFVVNESISTYTIYRNGTFILENSSHSWISNEHIRINVDNLDIGEYFYKIELIDGYGGFISNVVKIKVIPKTAISTFKDIFSNFNMKNFLIFGVIGVFTILIKNKLKF